MSSFGKNGGLCNSQEMILSVMPGMGLFISPSLQTYNVNIGIWWGSIHMYASMFWVTLACDLISFRCRVDIRFHDDHMIYVS